tara:strand:- start:388 stop:1479 length:1092 start_codon:yes stop_codon:yes gene_type:complete
MKKSITIGNLLIIATAISFPILITDQYMRLARLPRANSRVMLLSGGKLDSSGIGIRHYTPNSLMQQSVVFGDILEYSYKFKTDKYGFRVTHNCSNNKKNNNLVVITGDSFTEGQGSNSSWTESIQRRLCDQGHNSINVAISGYGVEGMKDSLDFAYEKLAAHKAIVAIIPNSIYRQRISMNSNHTCSMYEARKCGVSSTWWHHPEEFNAKDLIKFASTKQNFGLLPVLKDLTYSFKLKAKKLIGFRNTYSSKQMISRSISDMNSIALKYGAKNVSVIILPQKIDRNLSGSHKVKMRRRANLRIFLDSIDKNITVTDLRECPLGEKHFFRIDGHPNEKGHKLLGKCVLRKIRKSTNIKSQSLAL